jgi:hypothetical protein
MFGKWEVRELVYQINFPPFPARFDKRTKGRTIRYLRGGFDELFDGLSGKNFLGHLKKNIVQRNVAEKKFLQAIGG